MTTFIAVRCLHCPNPYQTLGAQDHLLLEINTDARHRYRLIRQSVCLWTGGVKMAISTFRTRPPLGPCNACARPHGGAEPRNRRG
jgi:hypothetical protein